MKAETKNASWQAILDALPIEGEQDICWDALSATANCMSMLCNANMR